MSETSSYHSNHRDRYPSSHHRHHHRDHHRDRSRGYGSGGDRRDYQDDRESGRSDRSQKRVPGHVSDPEKEENESDSVIGRGQRETVDRYAASKYKRTNSTDKRYKSTKDTLNNSNSANNMPPYDSKLSTITQSYYKRDELQGKKSSKVCNAIILAFLPGVIGVGCILAAIILIDWMTQVENDLIFTFGLFQVCTRQILSGGGKSDLSCQSSETFADAGSELSSLEQATRGLIIIAALIGFMSLVCAFIFGFNRFYRKWGAMVVGGIYAFAGAVAVAAMGVYSSFLTQQFANISDTETVLVTGGSFYLGWFGAACFIVGSITAFVGHCTE